MDISFIIRVPGPNEEKPYDETVHTGEVHTGEEPYIYDFIVASSYRAPSLVAAPFTPFKDGEVDHDMIKPYADYLVKTHFKGVFVNGSAGESMSLTVEERKGAAVTWMKACQGRMDVIVHVGANCLKDSQEMARHAESIGASAIAAVSPTYFKPENEAVMVDFMASVARSAPTLPFYYYDINFITGIYNLDVVKIMKLAKERIPTLVGLKHSSKQLFNAHACSLIDNGQLQVLDGSNQYLGSLALGMTDVVAISHFGNIFHDLREAYDRGDIVTARSLQAKIYEFQRIRSNLGGTHGALRAMFEVLSGLDIGPPRLPLRECSTEEKDSIRKELLSAGLINVAKPRGK